MEVDGDALAGREPPRLFQRDHREIHRRDTGALPREEYLLPCQAYRFTFLIEPLARE